ncbi:MAG TPA: TonB-dependent receptor, partial [Polyangiaceae bacterium]
MNHVRLRRGSIAAWAVLGSVTLFASSAFAQVGSAVLTGKIVDASTKAPVADAVVTVTSPTLQGEQLMVTDATGHYRIPGLPPGEYTIRLDKETYKPYSRSGIQLRADTTIQVSAEVLPEAIKEEIVVVGDPPTVDVGSSSTGTNISSEFVRRVPVAQPGTKGSQVRSFESAAEVAPGARFDDYGTSISGSSSPENQYVIDGVSVNDPAFGINGTPLSLEFIQETNVITGGYMPEYGRTTGGFLNVVTKSGSNEFHGSIFGYLSPGALQADRKAIRTGNTVTTDYSLKYQWDAGFDIGGPLIKDKLWFYAGFDYFETKWQLERNLNRRLIADGEYVTNPETGYYETERIPGTKKFYDATESGFQYIGKLSYAINRDNKVSLQMFGMPRFSGGDGNFGINPSRDSIDDLDSFNRNISGTYGAMAHNFDSWSNDVVAKYQTAFDNKHTLLDVSLGWHHQDGGRFPADGSPLNNTTG